MTLHFLPRRKDAKPIPKGFAATLIAALREAEDGRCDLDAEGRHLPTMDEQERRQYVEEKRYVHNNGVDRTAALAWRDEEGA